MFFFLLLVEPLLPSVLDILGDLIDELENNGLYF